MDTALKCSLVGEKLVGEEWGKDVIRLGDTHGPFEPIPEFETEVCEAEYNVVEDIVQLPIEEPLCEVEVEKTSTGLELQIGCGVDGVEDLVVTPSQLKRRPVRKALSPHALPLRLRLRDFSVPYMELLRPDPPLVLPHLQRSFDSRRGAPSPARNEDTYLEV